MDSLLQEISILLTTPPGNLIYHLGLLVALMAALQVSRLTAPAGKPPRRMTAALLAALLLQLAVLVASALFWQGLASPQAVLPPLDRFVTFLCMVLIGWGALWPERNRAGDAAAIVLAILGAGLLVYTYIQWFRPGATGAFNSLYVVVLWDYLHFGTAAAGLLAALLLRREKWGALCAFLLLQLAGAGADRFFPLPGDFPVFLRFALLSSYPILPYLAASPQQGEILTSPPPGDQLAEDIADRKKQPPHPRILSAFLDLAAEDDPQQMPARLTRALAQATLADLCFYLTPPDAFNQLQLQGGYDMIREELLPQPALHSAAVPNLAAAVQRCRPMRQNDTSSLADAKAIAAAIGLRDPGSLLFLPVANTDKNYGGFLFLSPYSNRSWTEDELDSLVSYNDTFIRFLKRVDSLAGIQSQTAANQDTVTQLSDQLRRLQAENERLSVELAALSQTAADKAQAAEIAALKNQRREDQETIETLKGEVAALQNRIKPSVDSVRGQNADNQIEMELRLTLEEVARLQNQLAEANIKILSLEQQRRSPGQENSEEHEVVASIVQELRQPMSSITGYTDLLLGESVGILGALQRKFLERIKASGERMRALMDDLLQITVLQDEQLEILPQPIDLAVVIDQAIADTSAQLREKNIALQVDLPDELPQIHADRDAIQQILIHLLRNAGTASPVEGTVSLHVRTEQETLGEKFLLIEVTDSGSGIAAVDLPKVFARRYRADNALIQGVGDSGVGLSIAKALVEAHGGRIWVDSTIEQGSTFSVLLPLHPGSESTAAGSHGDAAGIK